MNVFFLGAGAWATAMAIHASKSSLAPRISLWTRSQDHAQELATTRTNKQYLEGMNLPESIAISSSWADIFSSASAKDVVIIATPVAGLKDMVARLLLLPNMPRYWVWLCKGLDPETAAMPHQVIAQELAQANSAQLASIELGVLSGPSFAKEVALGLPCALTVASQSNELIDLTQAIFHHDNMRIYSSHDIVGVELGGAVKNVLAIATGISDGLGLGLNARAALLTRGLSEMMRLFAAVGGKPETAMGLSGVGDLILTATGDLSRNRQVGLQLAQGQSLATILQNLGHVAEGVRCAQAVAKLAQAHAVDMPITQTVCQVLFENLSPQEAVKSLMGRHARAED